MSKKVLLVEDEAAQRLLYQQELEDEGYEVFASRNGAEALNIVTRYKPDVAVLDIQLNGEDGLDLMGRIINLNENLPIILHTAYGAWKDNWRGRIADAYVVKSSDLSNLLSCIRDVLLKRKKR